MRKLLLITGLFVAILLVGCTPVKDGKYAKLAQCLTDKGVKFYGAFWCPHCSEQKKLFGSDIRKVTYIECDARGAGANPAACNAAGVVKYPSWFFPGQGITTGVFKPEELAKKANCSIEEAPAETEETSATETKITDDTAAAGDTTETAADAATKKP